jgi:acyl-CoA synthetase (NDP forming)
MEEIFYPLSVAVIGVSSKPDNLGRNIVANLVEYDFNGIVYAVGPSGGMIETRRIYRSVVDIPDHVDLAVVLTPAQTVPGILEECGQKGIRWAIIETAGFREYTDMGQRLEDEIAAVANKHGIRFVGPNCIGVINMENGFCVPFPRLKKFLKPGGVTMITQSGGVGMAVLNLLANEGLGLDKFVSVGNMLNLNAEDMLEYMIDDPGTELIFLYLESMGDGRRLMDIARRSTKPILAFKANIGKLGQNIAKSHTASLASDDAVVEAAFEQAGIIRVHDATTLGNNLKILRLPPMQGRRLAVISRSGGQAVIAADACELLGFDLAPFPESFLREIEKNFRASVIRLTNPLDLGDLFELELYGQIVERTLQLEGVDGVVFLHTSLSDAENMTSRLLLERLKAYSQQYHKPVAYYLSAAYDEIAYLKKNYDFPIFTAVVETVRALQISHRHCCLSWRAHTGETAPTFAVDKQAAANVIQAGKQEGRNLLLSEALEVLEYYGIPTMRGRFARNVAEAQTAAGEIGYPVALKIVAEEISHKSDVGGVQLNLRNAESLAAAFDEMFRRISGIYPQARLDGVLVQPMVTGGQELILGGRQDPQFGPVVLAGLGGIFVEIIGEAALRVAPITEREARELLENLRGIQILKGARGHGPSDIEAVIDALLRVSQLLVDFPEIKELDINPLRVFTAGEGCQALDARVLID